jgi:hypothetical protein
VRLNRPAGRRKPSEVEGDNEMRASIITEDRNIHSEITSTKYHASSESEMVRRPRRQKRCLERSSTPMLEMIERASDRDSQLPEYDVDDAKSESEKSLMSVDDSTMEKPSLVGLSRSVSLDSSDCSSSSGGSENQYNQTSGECTSREQPRTQSAKEFDVDKYMASREMSPLQERMNAVTVMPGAFFCIMFLLSGAWLNKSFIEENGYEMVNTNTGVIFDDSQCLSFSGMPHLHALPPLPLLAAAIGIVFHAPFSFIYHWKFAHRLPAGFARTNHWSRRMDQAMIHFCSAAMAYATSGRFDFFLVNALFNADCIYRQFLQRVRPRRNQARIYISVIAYTIPIVRRGDMVLFGQIYCLFAISAWLFSQYPIGGWSHSAFHVVMAFVPPLLMAAAVDLPASQEQLKIAAQCAIMAKDSLVS